MHEHNGDKLIQSTFSTWFLSDGDPLASCSLYVELSASDGLAEGSDCSPAWRTNKGDIIKSATRNATLGGRKIFTFHIPISSKGNLFLHDCI